MGIFRLRGGVTVPTSTNHNTTQKVNIFVKTKNVPKVLKCKINHNFFSQTWRSQTGGRGSPTWEKFSHFPVFLGGERPLHAFYYQLSGWVLFYIAYQSFASCIHQNHQPLENISIHLIRSSWRQSSQQIWLNRGALMILSILLSTKHIIIIELIINLNQRNVCINKNLTI